MEQNQHILFRYCVHLLLSPSPFSELWRFTFRNGIGLDDASFHATARLRTPSAFSATQAEKFNNQVVKQSDFWFTKKTTQKNKNQKTKTKITFKRKKTKRIMVSNFTPKKRGGSQSLFPGKLHAMMQHIESENLESVMSWVLNGHGFMIHNPEKLVDILPLFFGLTKYRSFRRQLNMWHFERIIIDGPNKGAFVHPYFVKHNPSLCALMSRHISLQPTTKLTDFTKMALAVEALSSRSALASKNKTDEILFSSLDKLLGTSRSSTDIGSIDPTPFTTTTTTRPVMELNGFLRNDDSQGMSPACNGHNTPIFQQEKKDDDVISTSDIEPIFQEEYNDEKQYIPTTLPTASNGDILLAEKLLAEVDNDNNMISSFEGRTFYFVTDECFR